MPYISVVIPVYNAVNIVDVLYRQLVENLEKITDDFEIIMVNDACPHGSGEKIAALAYKDHRVKFIDLARNFGQHIAISAGLDYAQGDYVVVMDCDLQDPPHKIGEMLTALQISGREVIFAIRKNRKDNFLKKLQSDVFFMITYPLIKKSYRWRRGMGNFSIITRKVALQYRKLREHRRNYASIIKYCGFRIEYYLVEQQARYEGQSSYTLVKSFKLAFCILLQLSTKPLAISLIFSGFSLFLSLLYGTRVLGAENEESYAGIMAALFLLGGIIFLTLAIISFYLADIFEHAKGRPLYIISSSMNLEK